jgi:DNA-binding NarL/FixJ family response regulator
MTEMLGVEEAPPPAEPAAEVVDGGSQVAEEPNGQSESRSSMLSEAPEGAQEGELVDQRLWAAIAVLRERGLSKKAIARQLELDIKTVRKWWFCAS